MKTYAEKIKAKAEFKWGPDGTNDMSQYARAASAQIENQRLHPLLALLGRALEVLRNARHMAEVCDYKPADAILAEADKLLGGG